MGHTRTVSTNMSDQDTEDHSKKPIIAAKLRGPGPGRYGLPSTVGYRGHDFTKHRKPAYPFGQRLGESFVSKICSPGPIYFIDAKYTRHGSDGTPNYSLLGRPRDPNEFKTPGPGSYKPKSRTLKVNDMRQNTQWPREHDIDDVTRTRRPMLTDYRLFLVQRSQIKSAVPAIV